MEIIDITDIDLNNSYFHFTSKDNIDNVSKEGLKATIGDASKMVNDKARVCFSKGGKWILGIKNSFIHEFKKLKICDIPNAYRKYFNIKDFSSTEIVKEEDVYIAMERKFKDETYLKVDVVENEDYVMEDLNTFSSEYDIKGKENNNIDIEKLSLITTSQGNSALDIVKYICNRMLEKNPGKEAVIRQMNSDLFEMLDYIKENKDILKIVIYLTEDVVEDSDIKKIAKETSEINKKFEIQKEEKIPE